MGIEPTRPAWKAGILPLNYTRFYLAIGIAAATLFCGDCDYIISAAACQAVTVIFNFGIAKKAKSAHISTFRLTLPQ
jgi:hypothetical protein